MKHSFISVVGVAACLLFFTACGSSGIVNNGSEKRQNPTVNLLRNRDKEIGDAVTNIIADHVAAKTEDVSIVALGFMSGSVVSGIYKVENIPVPVEASWFIAVKINGAWVLPEEIQGSWPECRALKKYGLTKRDFPVCSSDQDPAMNVQVAEQLLPLIAKDSGLPASDINVQVTHIAPTAIVRTTQIPQYFAKGGWTLRGDEAQISNFFIAVRDTDGQWTIPKELTGNGVSSCDPLVERFDIPHEILEPCPRGD